MNLTSAIQATVFAQIANLSNGRTAIRPPIRLAACVEQVSKRFGNGHTELVKAHKVQAAVGRLRTRGAAALKSRELYVLAYSLSEPLTVLSGRSVMAEESLIAPLLSRWRAAAAKGRLRSAVWRGLFRSYLQCSEVGGDARLALRRMLAGTINALVQPDRSEPLWLQVVRGHLGLLGDRPCTPYVDELLSGKRELLDDLVSGFSLPDASWVWPELVQALCTDIGILSSQTLMGRIDFLLALRRSGPFAAKARSDAILASLLDRYAKATDRRRHEGLLAEALSSWRSPQIRSHVAWTGVLPETKAMVCAWLAEQDLEDFYRLCKDAAQVDGRRLAYWLRFKEQVTFSQIAVGSAITGSRDADIQDFRRRNEGRLATLSGPATNNAIILQIGDYVFVEFSQTGNACYPYRADKMPFQIGVRHYNRLSLSSPIAVRNSGTERLLHSGRGGQSWEQLFDANLARWGISVPGASATFRPAAIAPRQSVTPLPSAAPSPEQGVLTPELRQLIASQGGKTADLRQVGGCLWVYVSGTDELLGRKLRAAGFKYKALRGYYFK